MAAPAEAKHTSANERDKPSRRGAATGRDAGQPAPRNLRLYRVSGHTRVCCRFQLARIQIGARRRQLAPKPTWQRFVREFLQWALKHFKAAMREFIRALQKLLECLAELRRSSGDRLPDRAAIEARRIRRREIQVLADTPPRLWPGGYRAYRARAGLLKHFPFARQNRFYRQRRRRRVVALQGRL
jgi:hypothetical protein